MSAAFVPTLVFGCDWPRAQPILGAASGAQRRRVRS